MDIKSLRKAKQLTQKEAAQKIGMSRYWYIDIELSRKVPSVKTAKKIAEFYGFDWTEIYK